MVNPKPKRRPRQWKPASFDTENPQVLCGWPGCSGLLGEWMVGVVVLPEEVCFDPQGGVYRLSKRARARVRLNKTGNNTTPVRRFASARAPLNPGPAHFGLSWADIQAFVARRIGSGVVEGGAQDISVREQANPPFFIICPSCGKFNYVAVDK